MPDQVAASPTASPGEPSAQDASDIPPPPRTIGELGRRLATPKRSAENQTDSRTGEIERHRLDDETNDES